MNNRAAFKNRFVSFYLLVLVSISGVIGQESNTLYFMKLVPQAYQSNPALQPGCRTFLGLPVAAPLFLSFENSAFALEDVIFPLQDSLITFLHPEADRNEFLDNLSPVNYTQFSLSTNLFSVGFRKNDVYYTFDFSEKIYAGFSYNDDLFSFLLLGNRRGDRFDFKNTGVDILSYFEYATGVSRNVNEKLTTGSRVKLLFGHANLTTRSKELELITDENWTLNSNQDLRVTVPGLEIPVDENGEFSPVDLMDFNLDLGFQWNPLETGNESDSGKIGFETLDPIDVIEATLGNMGLGIDLGMQYAFSDKLAFSASLIDLGAIRWNGNTYRLRNDESVVYRGIEVNPTDSAESGSDYADSLLALVRFSVDTDPYYTMLPLKLYAGCSFNLIDQISIGLLSRTEYFKRRFREQVTLSANFYPLKILAISLSYTIMNNTYNNFGIGFASRLGPFNLYLITDNLPTSYTVESSSRVVFPNQARNINFRFGMNLVFGCGAKEKKSLRDLPLVY